MKRILGISILMLALFQCCNPSPANKSRKKLRLPSSQFYIINVFDEVPIVLPVVFKADTVHRCSKLLDGDDRPSSWLTYFFNANDSNCITISKDELAAADTVCNPNDSSAYKGAYRYAAYHSSKMLNSERICHCNDLYFAEVGSMTFIPKNSQDTGVYAFMYIKDHKTKLSYGLRYNTTFRRSSSSTKDISTMLKSNLHILETIYVSDK